MDQFRSQKTFDLKKAGLLIVIDLLLGGAFALILYFRFSLPMGNWFAELIGYQKGDYGYIKEEGRAKGEGLL